MPFISQLLYSTLLSFQRVLENDENVEEGNEEEDLEEDIPKRKNRTRGRVSGVGLRGESLVPSVPGQTHRMGLLGDCYEEDCW